MYLIPCIIPLNEFSKNSHLIQNMQLIFIHPHTKSQGNPWSNFRAKVVTNYATTQESSLSDYRCQVQYSKFLIYSTPPSWGHLLPQNLVLLLLFLINWMHRFYKKLELLWIRLFKTCSTLPGKLLYKIKIPNDYWYFANSS